MFRTARFDNPYDPDDDGRDLEVTPEEEAASDDEGRAEAATLLSQMGTTEWNQNDRNFRRWLLRLAKKALADGAERRREARKKEKARAAAEGAAERAREENIRKAEKSKRDFERYCRESDERWARVDEETRAANAAWEADRPAREAAERAAKANPAPTSTTTTTRANGPATGRRHTVPPRVPTAARSPAPKAAINPAPERASAPAGSAGSPVRPVPWTEAPATRAPGGQPRMGSAHSMRLNPPRRLPASAPPAPPVVPRTAPSSSQPIPVVPAPPILPVPKASPTREVMPATPTRRPLAPSQPLPPPPPPSSPASPEPPPFTGADLATYRATLGLSQSGLAARLGATQGTVSKAEGKPTAVLGPTLRRAMWEARGGPPAVSIGTVSDDITQ